jgi:hypothetical protein
MRTRTQALLGLAGLAIIAGTVAGPTKPQSALVASDAASAAGALSSATDPTAAASKVASDQTSTAKAAADKAVADKAAADKAAADQAAAAKAAVPPANGVQYDFKLQPNYYYCGPAATRIALTAHGKTPSQDEVAKMLGTTTNGTNSAVDVTRVLNSQLGAGRYHTREIRGSTAKPAQMDQLQSDLVTAVNQGDVVVANVIGQVVDTEGNTHSYQGGHYLTAVGYNDNGRIATIADPADPDGDGAYQLSTIDLANWIATRGYAY